MKKIPAFLAFFFILLPIGSWAEQEVVFRILDAETGKPIAARCELTDPSGKHFFPSDEPAPGPDDPEYFYAWQKFPVKLQNDVEYTLKLRRGLGWNPIVQKFKIRKKDRLATVGMTSWYRPAEKGWLAGDLDGRFNYYEPGLAMAAQEISVLCRVVAAPKALADVEKISKGIFRLAEDRVYTGRDWGFGDFNVLGTPADVVGNETPFTASRIYYMDKGRKLGGLVDAVRPERPEIPVAVALGLVDSVRVVGPEWVGDSDWNRERVLKRFETYYRYLNCGFHLPVSAGSMASEKGSSEQNVIGSSRLYCRIPKTFTLGAFFKTVREGRSWATNGPALSLTVNGQDPGFILRTKDPKATLKVSFGARSNRRLDKVELVRNGEVIESIPGSASADYVVKNLELPVGEGGWIAARAFEVQTDSDSYPRYAHSSPVYIDKGGRPFHKKEIARDFSKQVTDLMRDLAVDKRISKEDKKRVLRWYLQAREKYHSLTW